MLALSFCTDRFLHWLPALRLEWLRFPLKVCGSSRAGPSSCSATYEIYADTTALHEIPECPFRRAGQFLAGRFSCPSHVPGRSDHECVFDGVAGLLRTACLFHRSPDLAQRGTAKSRAAP